MRTLLLALLFSLVFTGCIHALTLKDLQDVVRYLPRSQWDLEKRCALGQIFFIVDLRTKRIIASCPTIFTGSKANKIKLKSGYTLMEALVQGKVIALREGREFYKFKPQVYVDERMKILIGLLRKLE